ncbi:uncharacterized protein [Haliotis asinina]|uniref:uncharacterized protein n=1 Tax=Haliotis asinina TaxID=109174 RepID=UPI003531C6AA
MHLVKDVVSPSESVSITSPEQGEMLATNDEKDVSSVPERVTVQIGGDGDPLETSHCSCIHPQYKNGTTHALPNIFTLQNQNEKTYLQAFDFAKETFVTLNIEIETITDIAVDVDDGVVYIVENKSPASMISLSKFCCDGSSKITLATFKGGWLIASDPILDSVFYVRAPLRRGKPRIIMLNVNTRTEQVITKLKKMSNLIGADFVNQRIYWVGPHFDNRLKILSVGYSSKKDNIKHVVSLPQHTRERYWLFAAKYPIITWCATDDSAKQYFMDRKESRTVTNKSGICKRVGSMKNGFFVIWMAVFQDISSLMLYDQNGNIFKTIHLPSRDILVA